MYTLLNRSLHFMLSVVLVGIACVASTANAGEVEDFFAAVTMNDAGGVRSHLQRGLNPNIRDKSRGDTALIVALQEGSMNAFNVLISTPGIDLDAKANNGNTALMLAAYKGNRPAFDTLLQKGASINQHDWTPLHYAAAAGKNELVAVLLDKGADINARSPNLTTPLMIAAYEGFDMTVKLLLERGADVTLKNDTGMNAADYAKRLDRRDIIELVNAYLDKAEKRKAGQQSKNTEQNQLASAISNSP